jgi:acetyl esterase/lipase
VVANSFAGEMSEKTPALCTIWGSWEIGMRAFTRAFARILALAVALFSGLILPFAPAALLAVVTPQPSAPDPPVRLLDIPYANGPANLLDLYLPAHLDRPAPTIVWVHGGGWSAGDKKFCPAIPLARQGFIIAAINYRLSGQAPFPAQIYDCKAAIRFLRAHAARYHIDPDCLGAWGASAGGHLVALLGTSGGSLELEGTVGGNLDQSSRVEAVCDWYGPTDLARFADQAQAAGIIQKTAGPSLIMQLLGGSLKEKQDLVRLVNPITFIANQTPAGLPPFLIMHGDKDKTVPIAQSRLLYDALKKAGVAVQFKIIHGAGHGTGFFIPAVSDQVEAFFAATLVDRAGKSEEQGPDAPVNKP